METNYLKIPKLHFSLCLLFFAYTYDFGDQGHLRFILAMIAVTLIPEPSYEQKMKMQDMSKKKWFKIGVVVMALAAILYVAIIGYIIWNRFN